MALPIKTLAGQVIGLGFSLGADIVKASSYVQPANPAYNAQDGSIAPGNVTKSVNAMVLKFSQKDTDGTVVQMGDERLIIKCAEMGTVVPTGDDTITETVSGIVRAVIGYEKDPTGTMFVIHCRRQTKG